MKGSHRKEAKQLVRQRIKARLLADPTLTNRQLRDCFGCSNEMIAEARKEVGIFNEKSTSGLLSLDEAQAAIKRMGIDLDPHQAFLRRPKLGVKDKP